MPRSSNAAQIAFVLPNGNFCYAINVTNGNAGTPQFIATPNSVIQLRLFNSGASQVHVMLHNAVGQTVVIPTANTPGSAVGANGTPIAPGAVEILSTPFTPVVVGGVAGIYLYSLASAAGPFVLYVTPGEGL